eukprot:360328-Chlamydomonas_euryale.AAC.13
MRSRDNSPGMLAVDVNGWCGSGGVPAAPFGRPRRIPLTLGDGVRGRLAGGGESTVGQPRKRVRQGSEQRRPA